MSIKESVTALFKVKDEPNVVEKYLMSEDVSEVCENVTPQDISSQVFICKSKKALAKGFIDSNGNFTILKDSRISKQTKLKDNSKRDDLLKNTQLTEDEQYPDTFVLAEDIVFKSPSQASSFCLGYNSNGLKDWKAENSGVILKEVLGANSMAS